MTAAVWFAAGLLVGAAVGVVFGSGLGRHDDRTLEPWWLGVGV
jgi:hypothetical protein